MNEHEFALPINIVFLSKEMQIEDLGVDILEKTYETLNNLNEEVTNEISELFMVAQAKLREIQERLTNCEFNEKQHRINDGLGTKLGVKNDNTINV